MAEKKREAKKSCMDCHQSLKSCPGRQYRECTKPDCNLSNMKAGGNALNWPINKHCVNCLEENYQYKQADLVAADFVCPRCKGLARPKPAKQQRAPLKRVISASLGADLFLVGQSPDDTVLLPALKIYNHTLKEYLAEFTAEQGEAAKAVGLRIVPPRVATPPLEGRVPDGVPAAVPGEVPAPDAGPGTADKIKLESKLEPRASRNPPAPEPAQHCPFVLVFSPEKAGALTILVQEPQFIMPFEWTQTVVECFLAVNCDTESDAAAAAADGTDAAASYPSSVPVRFTPDQLACWKSFAKLYGERFPNHRPKHFQLRRTWKCSLAGPTTVPNLYIGLEVVGCPQNWAPMIDAQRNKQKVTLRLRKRTSDPTANQDVVKSKRLRERHETAKVTQHSQQLSVSDHHVKTEAEPAPTEPEVLKSATLTTADVGEIQWCKMAPPAPPARPPAGTSATYTFEADNVVRADLTDGGCTEVDKSYIIGLCQNPDCTVIIKGLTAGLTPELWTWEYLLQRCGHVVWKKIRSFIRKDSDDRSHWHENGWKTMSLRDYKEYLNMREAGDEGALNEVLYWIDFPMAEFLPELSQDFKRASPIDLFPGGSHCAQRWVTESARPDMGPNLYITPPGGRTWFHEDGNGTVDSGHQCLSGQNEVVMLRRMTDEPTRLNTLHKLNAGEDLDCARPHDDTIPSVATKQWPTEGTLEHLRDEMHAGPASFVLGAGEFVHINKGRLHAFRKKCPGTTETAKDICISVAWDWMFEGTDGPSIGSEIGTSINNLHMNKLNRRESLAISTSTVMHGSFAHMAKLQSLHAIGANDAHFLEDQRKRPSDHPPAEQAETPAFQRHRGSCAALEPFVAAFRQAESDDILQNTAFSDAARADLQKGRSDVTRVDAFTNPSMGDTYCPNANTPEGYDCWTCSTEIANLYVHCMGCQKDEFDYNLCVDCFKAGQHLCNDKQHAPCVQLRKSSRTTERLENTCFCGRTPCANCPECNMRGGGCKCCMCFQFRWRYAQSEDISNLSQAFAGSVAAPQLPSPAKSPAANPAHVPADSVEDSLVQPGAFHPGAAPLAVQ